MAAYTDCKVEFTEGKAGVEALQQMQEELGDEMRTAVSKVEALSAADREAAEKARKLQMAALEGAGGEGGVPLDAVTQLEAELSAMMESKADWQQIEEALATDDPGAAIRDLVGAACAGTVRLWVWAWEPFVRWFRWNRGRAPKIELFA